MILVVTTANVIMRAFFSHPIMGALELSTDMMVMVSYCSLPIITLLSDHISVDLIARKFSPVVQKILKFVNLIIYSLLCCYAGYATFLKGAYEKNLGTSGNALRIPYYIFYYIIGIMLLISVLCAIYNMVHIAVTGQEVTMTGIKEYSKRLLKKKQDQEKEDKA